MANWNGLILTDAGRNLQAKVEAGKTKLSLTKFKLGNGAISGQQTLEGLTDLVSPKQVIGINTCTPKENGLCTITGTIVNTGLTKGYELKELGVFATDPDSGEILYAITTDTHPDYLQPEGGSTVVSAEFSLNIAISNTDKVTAVIDVAGLASIGNVQTIVNQHNIDKSAHANIIDDHNADAISHKDIREALNKASGESIGHIGFTISNIPEGCLTLDTGALINRETYPQLWQFVQSSRNLLPTVTDSEWQTMADNQTSVAAFSTGDGSTMFRLPKLLDYPRGGTVADMGTWYGDAIRNITGVCTANGGAGFCSASGAMYVSDRGGATATGTPVNTHYDDLGIDISRQVPTAAENRPKTVVGVFYIRAFHGTTNQGNIDITELVNSVQRNTSTIEEFDLETVGDICFCQVLKRNHIKANGAVLQAADYPRLVQFVIDNDLSVAEADWQTEKRGLYVYDATAKTIRVPDLRNIYLQGADMAGQNIAAGLPNLYGTFSVGDVYGGSGSTLIAFRKAAQACASGGNQSSTYSQYTFDASKANLIYGKSTTVQPPAVTMIPQIKY